MFNIKTHLLFNENDNEMCGQTIVESFAKTNELRSKQLAETTFTRFKNQAV